MLRNITLALLLAAPLAYADHTWVAPNDHRIENLPVGSLIKFQRPMTLDEGTVLGSCYIQPGTESASRKQYALTGVHFIDGLATRPRCLEPVTLGGSIYRGMTACVDGEVPPNAGVHMMPTYYFRAADGAQLVLRCMSHTTLGEFRAAAGYNPYFLTEESM